MVIIKAILREYNEDEFLSRARQYLKNARPKLATNEIRLYNTPHE